MIAIPNFNPKDGLYQIDKGRIHKYKSKGGTVRVYDLIEIIQCGECKHMRKYALRSDEPMGIWCHRWSVPRLVTDDDFCSYGERRAE